MPHRFPPPEPKPLPHNFTQTQFRRHRTLMDAWHVGNALRSYDETLRLSSSRELSDDLSYLSSPAFDGNGGGRRLAENGTPASMDALCQWIDRQQTTMRTVKYAYAALQKDLPVHARIAWMYHVGLFTCQEIAEVMRVSYRTVVRYLGVANLYLSSELNKKSDSQTAREEAKKSRRRAEQDEAEAWKNPEAEPNADVLAAAGVESALTSRPKHVVRRVRKQ